jgi:hypothetical protein
MKKMIFENETSDKRKMHQTSTAQKVLGDLGVTSINNALINSIT